MNTTYTFEGKTKSFLIGLMVLGAICMGLTFIGDDEFHTRFWSNLLHNTIFFTGIAFTSVFFIAVCVTAWAGWHTVFKRVWEAMSSFLLVGLFFMIILSVGMATGMHHLYHWADPTLLDPTHANYDSISEGKSAFLNYTWYGIICLVIVAVWYFFGYKLTQLSREEDNSGGDENFKHHRTMRWWSAAFLPIAGFSSAAVIWLWVMSVDSHWYSTMYAWYATASWFVSMIALTIMLLIYLKGKGYYDNVTDEHIHDLGKFLFAFSIFWTYLWFSQYMLIWYSNVGEETIYFYERRENYPVLFYGNLFINFVLPFLILMRNDTKRKFGSVFFVSLIVLLGHWIDYFLMIKPGVLHTAHEIIGHHGEAGHGTEVGHAVEHASHFVSGFTLPGLLELGTFIGFLGLFLYVVLNALTKAPLEPSNDPYLEESLHHHV